MATKTDRLRAKVLEYDNYQIAMERFLALPEDERKLLLADETTRGYLGRASCGNTPEAATIRMITNPPKKIFVLVRGGCAEVEESTIPAGYEVEVVDFDNIEAGDAYPSEEAKARYFEEVKH